jgi:predicted ATPase/DNA-binding winged helix-turn-helix (wHTH) protein
MEVRVLGRIAIVDDGSESMIRSPKQRELLAFLATHAGDVVSTDRIIDALWGDTGGEHLSSLRFHVSKLRDLIDPGRDQGVIVTRAPGYALNVPATNVDAHRFEKLVGDAADLIEEAPAEARELLHDALDVWHEAPYAEFEYAEWARIEVIRLTELRIHATELRIDAELALGAGGDLVPELTSLVEAHPLRERFWRQLLLALHRSGRQPDALRAYRRACDIFAELGTEPSSDLRHLEEQVLLHDRALVAAPTGSPATNLPTALSSFIGRTEDIAAVRNLITGHRLVTLTGAAGVGKTRLAVEVARGLLDQFDGLWLINLADLDDPGDRGRLVAEAGRIIAIPEVPHESPYDSVVGYLAPRRGLLVFDNCEHVADPVAALITDLLEACPRLRVLATSRRPLRVDGEVTRRVPPLPFESDAAGRVSDCASLFLDRARAADPAIEPTAESRQIAADVCRRLAGLPLAVELAAARLRMMSIRNLAGVIADTFAVLTGGPSTSVPHHHALRATLDWSYDRLDGEAQAFFRRIAVFRGGFTLDTATRCARTFADLRRSALDLVGCLVDASMVTPTTDDRFTMLQPIREYGLARLAEHGETAPARRAHADLFHELFRSDEVPALFGTDPEDREVIERFITERDNVVAALTWAIEAGDAAIANDLGGVTAAVINEAGSISEAKRWLDAVLAVPSPASQHRAAALCLAAYLTAVLDRPDAARSVIGELIAVAEALDDERWRAIAISRQALIAGFVDDVEAACRLYEAAARRLLRIDHPDARQPLNNLLDVLTDAGRYDRARDVAVQLGALGRRFGRSESVESALVGLGYLAVCRGEPDAAERHLDEASAYLQAAGHESWMEPAYLTSLRGFIALLRNDLTEAAHLASAALRDARESRHPDSLYRALVVLGLTHLREGAPHDAARVFGEGLRSAGRAHQRTWQRYVLAPLAAALAMIDPPVGASLVGAVRANDSRDDRRLPCLIEMAIRQAEGELRHSLDPDVLRAALSRGARASVDDAVGIALRHRDTHLEPI